MTYEKTGLVYQSNFIKPGLYYRDFRRSEYD